MSSPLSDVKSKVQRVVRRKKKPKKPTGFTMRPLKFLARQVATERNFAPLPTAVVTKGLLDDIKFAFEHKWNTNPVFVGGPGEGKSRGVWRYAKEWLKLTLQIFKYCWDIDQIPDTAEGGWFHIDEWFIPEGQGKLQALQRIKHLFDTGRLLMKCISVSTPTAPNLPFCTFEATTLAQDFDNRLNLFEIRVPLPRFGMVYIGNAIIPLGEDDDAWIQYEKDSRARKTEIWDKKGKKVVGAKFDVEKVAQEVIDWARKNKYDISSDSKATTLVRKLAEERGWDTNYATEPDIVNWVSMIRKKRRVEDKASAPKKFGEFSPGWKGLQEFVEEWCLKQKPPRKEYAEGTAQWIVPTNPPTSKDDAYNLVDFGTNPVKVATLVREITNLKRRIQRPDREFTDFTESWLASQLDIIGARKVGGQDAPDIILPDGNEIAVKFCVRNDPFYDYTVSPETNGLVIIIIPRKLQFFVIPIEGTVVNEHLQLDNSTIREKGALVGIDELVRTVKEMLERLETMRGIEFE